MTACNKQFGRRMGCVTARYGGHRAALRELIVVCPLFLLVPISSCPLFLTISLVGGTGHDTYYWHTGDGNDKIIDPDGGRIVINGTGYEIHATGVFRQQKDAQGHALNIWKRSLPDGKELTLTHNSPWKLVLEDGSTIQLGDNQADFQNGDFGIHLSNAPDAAGGPLLGTAGADVLNAGFAAYLAVEQKPPGATSLSRSTHALQRKRFQSGRVQCLA